MQGLTLLFVTMVVLTIEGEKKDSGSNSISLNDPSAEQNSNFLAYRPDYKDYHSSGLAGLFVDIEKVFPQRH